MPERTDVQALIFDIFGTVVDWRTSLIDDFTAWSAGRGIKGDWAALVDAWRQAYVPSMDQVRKNPQLPFVILDDLRRRSLERLVQDFGITPKVALLSTSNFGARSTPNTRKMRRTVKMLMEIKPDLEVEGEMQADVALDEALRSRIFPSSRLKGAANLLVMPTLEAANIAFSPEACVAAMPTARAVVGTSSPIRWAQATAVPMLPMVPVA